MNKVQIIGNLTRDPEVNTSANGTTFAKFSVAVTRKFANAAGERETDFIACTAFGKTAELIGKYLVKGSKAGLSGSLQNNNYEDKDGNKVSKTGIIVDDVTFLDNKETGEALKAKSNDGKPESSKKETKGKAQPVEDEDLPF